MPADPDTIKQDLLDLLADGESVLKFTADGQDYHVLWRKSMLNPEDWNGGNYVTMVDFSSELFGLSTLWLPDSFYPINTDHFGDTITPFNTI